MSRPDFGPGIALQEAGTEGCGGRAASGREPRDAFPGLEGLRGIAAVAVLVYHCAALTSALALSNLRPVFGRLVIAVPIFFAISGFVLYRPFVAARIDGRSAPSLARYGRRRLARILPAYWVALGIALAIPNFTHTYSSLGPVATGAWWKFFGLLQIYSASTAPEGFGHAWSICVEASFYAVLATYVVLMSRSRDVSMRAELAMLLVLGLTSAALRIGVHVAAHGSFSFYPWNVTLATNFTFFAIGMALAVGDVHRLAPLRWGASRPLATWGAAIASFALLCVLGLPPDLQARFSDVQWAVEHLGYAVVTFLVMVAVVAAPFGGGPISAMLRSRPCRALGRISYGFYLSHLPLMFLIADAGALHWLPGPSYLGLLVATGLASAAYGTASWVLIESPALRAANRPFRRRT